MTGGVVCATPGVRVRVNVPAAAQVWRGHGHALADGGWGARGDLGRGVGSLGGLLVAPPAAREAASEPSAAGVHPAARVSHPRTAPDPSASRHGLAAVDEERVTHPRQVGVGVKC